MIKAVGFDIDGTLYPNYQMLLCSIPSLITAPRLMYYFGQVRKEIRGIEYDESLHEKQAQLLANKMGLSPEKAGARMERHLYHRWEHSFRCIRAFRHVRETLLAFKRAGLPLAALSDFPIAHKLNYLKLDDLFDYSFSSEETGYLKPNSIPFQQMVRKFGLAPEEILYVGNSYKYDIIGASNVGMQTAWLSFSGRATASAEQPRADIVFSSFIDLREMVLGKLERDAARRG